MPFYGGRWQQTLLLGEGERIRMRIRLYGAMRHQNRPKLPGRDDHDLVAVLTTAASYLTVVIEYTEKETAVTV